MACRRLLRPLPALIPSIRDPLCDLSRIRVRSCTREAANELETWEPSSLDHVYRCAPTFEAFVYRFWMENEVGFRTRDGEALTPELHDYLEEARRLYVG